MTRAFYAFGGRGGSITSVRHLLVFFLTTLCCCGQDPDAQDSGTDGAGDTEPDRTIGPEECPRNSAWPCTCDRQDDCDDGSPCVSLPIVASNLGVCAAPCIPNRPPAQSCPDDGFPGPAWCQIQSTAGASPTHCLMICAHSDNCPPDQECVDPGIEGVPGYCLP